MYCFYRANYYWWSPYVKGRQSFIFSLRRTLKTSLIKNSDTIQPRRAILYVPGHDRRKIDKIRTLNVDCAVLDCEDGVAINMKSAAREVINKISDSCDFGKSEYAVRINSVDSNLAEDDICAALSAKRIPPTIMVPKVESVNHIMWIHDKLKRFKPRSYSKKLNLIIFIESAKSLLDLRQICERAIELSHNGPFNFEGIVFGSDDFIADIGAVRTADALELLTARQMIVIAAKSFKLQAIDMVHIDYKDLEHLSKVSKESACFGFTGKQVIHPNQVPIVQAAFLPSAEKVQWAKELVKQFALHQESGIGAFTYRGHMIDKPLLLQAQNILKLVEAVSD